MREKVEAVLHVNFHLIEVFQDIKLLSTTVGNNQFLKFYLKNKVIPNMGSKNIPTIFWNGLPYIVLHKSNP